MKIYIPVKLNKPKQIYYELAKKYPYNNVYYQLSIASENIYDILEIIGDIDYIIIKHTSNGLKKEIAKWNSINNYWEVEDGII